jgi:hypothetical protein
MRTIIKNSLKQEPDYSLQVITSQNWTCLTRLPAPSVMRPNKLYLWLNNLTMHTLVPCPQFFCLFKPIAHVCTLEDGWRWAECLLCLFPCPELCDKSPFSAFIMPLYLAFRGRWPDLAYGRNLRSLGLGSETLVSDLHCLFLWGR